MNPFRSAADIDAAAMPGYLTKQERIAVAGVADLTIRSLLDRQQFFDPHGNADRRGISSATWPLFGLLWPSGAHLAARLAARPVRAGERILEVGCGLALASLVGHRRGADVTASDCHPLAASFLRRNLRLNGLAPMPYRHGDWAAGETRRRGRTLGGRVVRGRFDLIIGSDLLYERDDRSNLATSSAAMPRPRPRSGSSIPIAATGRLSTARCRPWASHAGKSRSRSSRLAMRQPTRVAC